MRTVATIAAIVILAAPALAQPELPRTEIEFEPPEVVVPGYDRIDFRQTSINVADLEDDGVYSAKTGDRIGEVDEVYVDSTGGPTILGIEVGGLLDIGDREIAIPLDQLSIYQGGDTRVYIDATAEEIGSYPEFELE